MRSDAATYSAPEFTEPKVLGQSYEAVVPDTLDLAERAALALHGLGGGIDPGLDYQHWFKIAYASNPPYMRHHAADPTTDTLIAESFPLL